jgi:chitinase
MRLERTLSIDLAAVMCPAVIQQVGCALP